MSKILQQSRHNTKFQSNVMKKLIETLLGAEVHASAKNINGRKSSGKEDDCGYEHWRLIKDQGGNVWSHDCID